MWINRRLQYILRVKGAGVYDVVIVPYNKGERPATLELSLNPGGGGYLLGVGSEVINLLSGPMGF